MSLAPPWIIFADKGKSVAILPAGRPGEVANVEALPDRTVKAIVDAANTRERGFYERFSSLEATVTETLVAELESARRQLEAWRPVVDLAIERERQFSAAREGGFTDEQIDAFDRTESAFREAVRALAGEGGKL